jgi:hypothetical protein
LFIPSQGLVRVGQGLDQLYPVDKNNFGPRAGIAWDVNGDGKTSVRAGYALTYDLPDFKTIHSPNTTWSGLAASAGAMTNPDLGVFSVSPRAPRSRFHSGRDPIFCSSRWTRRAPIAWAAWVRRAA